MTVLMINNPILQDAAHAFDSAVHENQAKSLLPLDTMTNFDSKGIFLDPKGIGAGRTTGGKSIGRPTGKSVNCGEGPSGTLRRS